MRPEPQPEDTSGLVGSMKRYYGEDLFRTDLSAPEGDWQIREDPRPIQKALHILHYRRLCGPVEAPELCLDDFRVRS